MDVKKIVERLIDPFLKAGDLSMYLREKGLKKQIKSDNTPVSNGDLEVNKFISKKISEVTPDIPIISEETSDNKDNTQLKDFWLVDPIDGTYDYINDLEEFLSKFGFSKRTGIELSGESKGSFDPNKTCITCLSSLSIGYSINVTQMQMVKAYSIIANGGKNVDLTLIKAPYSNYSPNQVIDSNSSERLKNLLINVVEGENGTGRSIFMENYTIGGKTGTSRTHIEGVGYSNYRFNTSFTGFIETNEGPIVGSVILWGASVSPYTEYVTGGSTAAPIFKKIVSYLVPGE